MRRQVYIAIVALAALMLLTVSFVPHHHHVNALCTIVEHCKSDNTDNDEHTHHHDDGTFCLEKGIPASLHAGFSNTVIHKVFPSSTPAFYSILNAGVVLIKCISDCEERPHIALTADFYKINALRAPPLCTFLILK